jgi:hypothetical protein
MKAMISVVMAAGLSLATATNAAAQTTDAPQPGQMGPQGMTGQTGSQGIMVPTVPMGPAWMMIPMGPQGIAPAGPQGWTMQGPQAMWPGGMGGAFYRFGIVDADSDGIVSDAEAASNHEEVFVTMDADEDGALTREEYLAIGFGPGPMMTGGTGRFHAQAQDRKASAFTAMDGDADGSVSQREWMAAGEQRFAAADHDGNGAVTVWEFRSARRF